MTSYSATAVEESGFDGSAACEHAEFLRHGKRYGEALRVILSIPAERRGNPRCRTVLGRIYHDMSWHAHAVEAYGSRDGLPKEAWRSRQASWWRSGGPVARVREHMAHHENEIDRAWKVRSGTQLAEFDKLHLQKGRDVTRVRGQVDNYLLRRASLDVQQEARERRARNSVLFASFLFAMWLATAGAIYALQPGKTFSDVAIVATFIVLVAGDIMELIHHLIGKAVDERQHARRERLVQRVQVIFYVAAAVGLVLMLPPGLGTWPQIAGLGIVVTALVQFAWLWPVYQLDSRMRRIRDEHRREITLSKLFQLLGEIGNADDRNHLEVRDRWINLLEDVAWLVEQYLHGLISGHDPATREWVSERASYAATAARKMASDVAAPPEDNWDKLMSDLRYEATAIVDGDFGAMKQRRPPPFAASLWLKRRAKASPALIGAVIVLVVLLVGATSHRFQVIALALAVVLLLFIQHAPSSPHAPR